VQNHDSRRFLSLSITMLSSNNIYDTTISSRRQALHSSDAFMIGYFTVYYYHKAQFLCTLSTNLLRPRAAFFIYTPPTSRMKSLSIFLSQDSFFFLLSLILPQHPSKELRPSFVLVRRDVWRLSQQVKKAERARAKAANIEPLTWAEPTFECGPTAADVNALGQAQGTP
jgi:hypothetical protein